MVTLSFSMVSAFPLSLGWLFWKCWGEISLVLLSQIWLGAMQCHRGIWRVALSFKHKVSDSFSTAVSMYHDPGLVGCFSCWFSWTCQPLRPGTACQAMLQWHAGKVFTLVYH